MYDVSDMREGGCVCCEHVYTSIVLYVLCGGDDDLCPVSKVHPVTAGDCRRRSNNSSPLA